MKCLFEAEDSIIGIIVGLLFIGLSGVFFALPKFTYDTFVWGGIFAISLIFTVLDVKHTFRDLSGHALLLVILLLNNAIDFVIELGMAAKMFGLNIPYITTYLTPYMESPMILLFIGVFFIGSSIFWMVDLARL